MSALARRAALLCGLVATTVFSAPVCALEGQVIDAGSGAPIAGAAVTFANRVTLSDRSGHFAVPGEGDRVMVRAPGYRAASVPAARIAAAREVRLEAFQARALYLSVYGVGSPALRDQALQLIRKGNLNALVVDVKGDRGLIPYRTRVPLAHEMGADRITTIRDLRGFVSDLQDRGIYAIARIVVFKDDPLATARPDLAVKNREGGIFRDREGLAWTDPFRREVWDYNIAIAEEAAHAGFDEIQFDYVRFPDAKDVRFSEASTESTRIAAITGFLAAAKNALSAYNVYLAIDVFGYICWNIDDTDIGQRLEDLIPFVDYVSPMLYPSTFQFGIPGYPNPVEHPYEIVRLSLERALARAHISPLRFRPWLQAFKDYAFDRRAFEADEVKAQIKAAESAGADGWMLWNPRNVYTRTGF